MRVELKEVQKNRYKLEVTGCSCPFPVLYTLRALKMLKPGDALEVLTDNRPSSETIPEAITERGHRVLNIEQVESALWRITILKGAGR